MGIPFGVVVVLVALRRRRRRATNTTTTPKGIPMFNVHPDVVLQAVRDHQETLRRQAGDSRLRRERAHERRQHRHRHRLPR